ncbi:hypothetical protein H9L39_10690 [Fusarium oxysporum f. sp. albedinis]|nr:hypothetical protein H9L39_10690 [Fusarium oxysporum f. sp. albedinis]
MEVTRRTSLAFRRQRSSLTTVPPFDRTPTQCPLKAHPFLDIESYTISKFRVVVIDVELATCPSSLIVP